jgi:photosystem II stability/assembly factor-like uncharacterized protein
LQLSLAALLIVLGLVSVITGALAVSMDDDQWTFTGGPWSAAGDVKVLAVDPAAADTAYAVVEAAGIDTLYRTVDGGANWTAVSTFFTETINTLAVSGTLAYVGQSDAEAAVLRSTDRGANWAPVYTAVTATTVHNIAINPQLTTTAFAVAQAGGNGVVLSTTNGLSWAPVFTIGGDITELSINPLTPTQVFVGAQNSSTTWAEVHRSNDSGHSWERVFTSTERLEPFLLVHPVTPTTAFALTRPPGCCPPFAAHLWRSDDGGASWNHVSTGGLHNPVFAAPDTIYTVIWDVDYTSDASAANPTWVHAGDDVLPEYPLSVAVDHRDGHLLYAGLRRTGAYISTDSGASFQLANEGIRSNLVPHSIVIDPRANSTVYAATDSGGYRSVNGGTDWTRAFTPCKTLDFAVHRGSSGILLLGSDQIEVAKPALYRSTNGGAQWTAVYTPARPWGSNAGYALAFDPQAANRVYAVTGSASPATPTENEVLRSDDAGLSWTVVLTSSGWDPGLDIVEVSGDSTVYVAGRDWWQGSGSGGLVYRSTDQGGSWTRVYAAESNIIGLAIDPQRAATLYIIDDANRLFKSTDAGDNWTNTYTATCALRALAHDTSVSGHLYLGTDGPTVLASSDGGQTWSELTDWAGSVAPRMSSLAVDYGPVTRTLYAGVNGVWVRSYAAPRHTVYLPLVLRGVP